MHPAFAKAVESLHPKFELLIGATPHVRGGSLPMKGVYMFRENGIALYVGRSNTIPRRYGQHTLPGAQINQASFAMLIVREERALAVDYRAGARARLLADVESMAAFQRAKARILAMEFRAVEETDQTRQALLEIYCAVALGARYNDFKNH